MAAKPKKMTTISYAILGLLDIKPHTPYELAQQIRRSGIFWSAAESVVYEEPKALVTRGFAKATADRNSARARTIYTITAKGRNELKRWLTEPSDGPQVQFEAMLKVLYAQAGTRDDLLASIKAVRAWAENSRDNGEAISQSYLDNTAPYPDRSHIVSLTMAYQIAFVDALERWADWAEARVAEWSDTDPPEQAVLDVFRHVVDGESPI